MKDANARASALFLLAGVLAAAGALMPCRDLAPPPPYAIDPATASVPELLTLPGVGRARAEAMWAERVLGGGARARGE